MSPYYNRYVINIARNAATFICKSGYLLSSDLGLTHQLDFGLIKFPNPPVIHPFKKLRSDGCSVLRSSQGTAMGRDDRTPVVGLRPFALRSGKDMTKIDVPGALLL